MNFDTTHFMYNIMRQLIFFTAIINNNTAVHTHTENMSKEMAAPKRTVGQRIVEEIYTCCAFWIAASALPALAVSYLGKQ